MPKDIVYIGSSYYCLEKLIESDKFNVVDILCLRKKINENIQNSANKINQKIRVFDWIKDFKSIILEYDKSTVFLIYQLDMLVPKYITENYNFYNLHRGDLKTNRGPCPDIWTVLLGEKNTSISLHRINEKIDSGLLIGSYDIIVDKNDDPRTVKINLEKGIPSLINMLSDHLLGTIDGTPIHDGEYRPWINEQDYTIDLDNDSIDCMQRKILCQYQYNGAILHYDGSKRYVKNVSTNPHALAGNILKIERLLTAVYFEENTDPHYSPPPYRPPSNRV